MNDHRHLGDEVLSAHLDDRIDGPERAGVEAHLGSCDECEGRRAALGGTRDLLVAAPVERLDDVTRRRLVSRAAAVAGPGSAGTRREWWRHPVALGAAAVGVLVLAAGVTMTMDDGGGDDAALDAGSIDPSLFAGDLGDLDDPTAIRLALGSGEVFSDAAGGTAAGGGAGSAAGGQDPASDEAAPEAPEATPGAPGTVQPTSQRVESRAVQALAPPSEEDLEAAGRCITQVAPPEGSRLVLAATGEFQGAAAVVLAYRTGDTDRVLALVLARDDCAILSAQSFR